MALPTSGTITFAQIGAEAGIPAGTNIWLDHPTIRALAGKTGSGTTIAFSDFYGKSGFSAYGVNAEGYFDTTRAAGTVSCTVSVVPSGGSGSYTYQWFFVSNGLAAGASNTNTANCTISKSVGRLSSGSGSSVLQCTVTDTGGRSITVNNIIATLSWDSSQ